MRGFLQQIQGNWIVEAIKQKQLQLYQQELEQKVQISGVLPYY